MKKLVLVGLNHRTAPIEVRERLAFPEKELGKALHDLSKRVELFEGMIVSTCNRVEILAAATEADSHEVKRFLSAYHSFPLATLDKHLYTLRDRDAVQHVFRVAASLDSMVVGEPQILSQMKEAFHRASECGCVGSGLNALMSRTFFVAKRIRTETRIAQSPVSVSSVAVELAKKIFDDLAGKTILILGAGRMARLAAESLVESGVNRVLVANRSEERGQALAKEMGSVYIKWNQLPDWLPDADIVLVSTRSSRYVISPQDIQATIRKRRYRPLFLIDVSVPRNIDPAVNDINNVFLFDIDDLQAVVDANLGERRKEADIAEAMISQEVEKFYQQVRIEQTGPVVAKLRSRLEELVTQDFPRNHNGFSPAQVAAMEKTLLQAAHRIAHPMIMKIKDRKADTDTRTQTIELLREIFNLEDEEP